MFLVFANVIKKYTGNILKFKDVGKFRRNISH